MLALFCAGWAGAQPVAIVVHPEVNVESVTRNEISKIFLRRLRTWQSGQDAFPVDQAPESPERRAFSRWAHRRSVVTIEVYWKQQIFSGRAVPPPEVADDEAVLEYVRATPGAIGYVSPSTPREGVRTLALRE